MNINTKEVDRNYTIDFQSFERYMVNKYERDAKTRDVVNSIRGDVQQFADSLVREGLIDIEIRDSLINFIISGFPYTSRCRSDI